MSAAAKRRLAALSEQLVKPIEDQGTFENIPILKKIAPDSTGPRVKGKVIIVTGTNSPLGIGRASAHQFAQNGARAVYICDYNDANLETHKRELASLYPDVKVHARKFDAADEQSVKEVVDHAGLINSLRIFSADDFLSTLRTNVVSVAMAAKYSAPAMMRTSEDKKFPSGSIIATASVAGLRSNAGSSDYSASKSSVISLAQTISYQLAGTGIRVNAICPGVIETGMTAQMYEAARARGSEKKIGQLNPLGRGAHADEVARVALFLGSEESSYVNGQAWAVDGGLSAGHPFVPGKLG
ncbi:hypothetical protein EYC84_009595 [Monilinia fructicola]|uniref:Uncharacterized protein n=1 Tax=Monilinia fructicola TaxID=38448 RepID=A0A5M9J8C8_MONFR|nr:hypothetical protein EYC84_009595 [Monilinia fructicola]